MFLLVHFHHKHRQRKEIVKEAYHSKKSTEHLMSKNDYNNNNNMNNINDNNEESIFNSGKEKFNDNNDNNDNNNNNMEMKLIDYRKKPLRKMIPNLNYFPRSKQKTNHPTALSPHLHYNPLSPPVERISYWWRCAPRHFVRQFISDSEMISFTFPSSSFSPSSPGSSIPRLIPMHHSRKLSPRQENELVKNDLPIILGNLKNQVKQKYSEAKNIEFSEIEMWGFEDDKYYGLADLKLKYESQRQHHHLVKYTLASFSFNDAMLSVQVDHRLTPQHPHRTHIMTAVYHRDRELDRFLKNIRHLHHNAGEKNIALCIAYYADNYHAAQEQVSRKLADLGVPYTLLVFRPPFMKAPGLQACIQHVTKSSNDDNGKYSNHNNNNNMNNNMNNNNNKLNNMNNNNNHEDDIIFITDVDITLPLNTFSLMRRYIRRGKRFYAPVVELLPENNDGELVLDPEYHPGWAVFGFPVLAAFVDDVERAQGFDTAVFQEKYGFEDVDLFFRLKSDARLQVARPRALGMEHRAHRRTAWHATTNQPTDFGCESILIDTVDHDNHNGHQHHRQRGGVVPTLRSRPRRGQER